MIIGFKIKRLLRLLKNKVFIPIGNFIIRFSKPIIYIFIKKYLKKVRSNQGKRYVIDGFYELDDKGKIKLSGFKRKRRK